MSRDPAPAAAAGSGVADAALLLAAAAVPLALAGCGGGGGGGGGGAPPPALSFTSIALTVTTSDPAADVSVDATPATGGTATFDLDGGHGRDSRARDPGWRAGTASYDFAIAASSSAGSAAAECYVAINPSPERYLDPADPAVPALRHLYARLGFAAGEEDLARWLNVPYATAVGRIVDEASYEETVQSPPDAASFHQLSWRELQAMSTADQKAYNDSKSASLQRLCDWWWREMVISRHPLLERMALFWSGHLVVAQGDIFEPKPMWGYLDLIRRNALGSFRDLIHAMAREPAMVAYLNSDSNVKGSPNENFARELMELFTLGEGQVYSEADVPEVAKCFTGWGLTDHMEFIYRQDRHEPGTKTVFATAISTPDSDPEQVRKDGEAVIDLILAQSRVAVYLCGKLWDEFIGGTRDDAVIAGWATTFRGGGDYDVRRVLKAIFTSTAFTDAAQRGNMLRSPIEQHVGVHRAVGLEPLKYADEHWQASDEEQQLLSPPNVRGWVGGLQWITARTLLSRRTHMQWLGWGMYNNGHQRVPERLRPVLEVLWFATPVVQRSYVDAYVDDQWDLFGSYIRRLLVDPALNCK